MTKTQVEVITSVQRRRSWSRAEKERIVAAALEPGAVASEVARAAGIHTSGCPTEAVEVASAARRRRSPGSRVMQIPVRMRQTRMRPIRWESRFGFKC